MKGQWPKRPDRSSVAPVWGPPQSPGLFCKWEAGDLMVPFGPGPLPDSWKEEVALMGPTGNQAMSSHNDTWEWDGIFIYYF